MSNNHTVDPKLSELTNDGNFRAKVQLTLQSLTEQKERPKIFEAMRTLAQQRERCGSATPRRCARTT
jgi:hypothetical protein